MIELELSLIQSLSSISSSSSENMNDHEDNPIITLKIHIHPIRITTPSCIMFPLIYHKWIYSLGSENSYLHIREFEEVMSTFQIQSNGINYSKLSIFHIFLKDKSKS